MVIYKFSFVGDEYLRCEAEPYATVGEQDDVKASTDLGCLLVFQT
jgi:hypothetical protein